MSEKRRKTTAAARARRERLRRRRRRRRILWRCILSLLTLVALILCALLCAGWVAFRGPSQTMGDLLTVTMQETSALKFVPRIYYSEAQMQAVLARNQVGAVEEETDTSLIVIAPPTPEPTQVPEAAALPDFSDLPDLASPAPSRQPVKTMDGIEVYPVSGGTYSGYMMVVQDPARVSVGVCREGFNSKPGLRLHEIAERYDAVAAVNGGAFEDTNGQGNGGKPTGLVICDGEVLSRDNLSSMHNVAVGFNEDDILVFGKFTAEEALEHGMRDALAFGPVLISNGEPAPVTGAGSGLNPRTAIGQRADGAVLMLVIDGRQATSLGATYADLIDVMVDYGAVNAVNLDGGSSSMLYLGGEYLNNGVALTGSRKLPTAFVVR